MGSGGFSGLSMHNSMKQLNKNIINIFGEQGQKWLNDLPEIIELLCTKWQLSNITPVENMTYNYVAKVTSKTRLPLILKIGCDEKIITPEKKALIYFHGKGSIALVDYNEQYNALLLQQAVPGITLKSFYPNHIEHVMDNYISAMQNLHQQDLPIKNNFEHIRVWLKAIDQCNSPLIPKYLLEKAIYLKNKLLDSLNKEIVLHGDLHHDNILLNGNEWLTIDPKGILGDAEFEIAAFDFLDETEFSSERDLKKLFENRAETIAKKSNLSLQRIKDWVFVRLILSAAWFVEDKGDPSGPIKLAEGIFG